MTIKLQYSMGVLPCFPEDAVVSKSAIAAGGTFTQHAYSLTPLPPPLLFNLREDSGVSNPMPSQEMLAYLQSPQGGNGSVLVFIHGYNISYGRYGHVYELSHEGGEGSPVCFFPTAMQAPYHDSVIVKWRAKSALTTGKYALCLSGAYATIYRCALKLRSRFKGVIVKKTFLQDSYLNGVGAHNWWLHMEYNLNVAANFKGLSYYCNQGPLNYIRLLNIAWQGDPLDPLNYEQINQHAFSAADKLMPILVALYQEKIKINIIAHSAGNLVLLKVCEQLGKGGYKHCIQHAFLWEAAVPSNVLSPRCLALTPNDKSDWSAKMASKSVAHFTVLHSLHDNVLGPFPVKKSDFKALTFWRKFNTPGGGREDALIALSINVFDEVSKTYCVPNAMTSLYHLAQMLEVPFIDLMLQRTLREKHYRAWRKRILDVHAFSPLADTLSRQVLKVEKKYPHIYTTLYLFFGLLLALLFNHLYQFLSSDKAHHSLADLLSDYSTAAVSEILKGVLKHVRSDLGASNMQQLSARLASMAKNNPGLRYLHKLSEHLSLDVFVVEHCSPTILKTLLDIAYLSPDVFSKGNMQVLLNYFITKNELFSALLLEVGEEAVSWADEHNRKKLAKALDVPEDLTLSMHAISRASSEVATFLITLFDTPYDLPLPAMGYIGVDEETRLFLGDKLTVVDQSSWLMHHSAMKIPSEAVMRHVYKDVILAAPGLSFGAR